MLKLIACTPHDSDLSAIPPASATRSVERATALLRLVMTHQDGARLVDLAEAAGLHKATALRLLAALERDGLIERDPASKRYTLGMDVVVASWISSRGTRLRDFGAAAIRRIADDTGDTAFLSVRSGLDSLCIDRAEGDYPIKTLTLDVGSRRPLGVGAGSLALLAFLPPDDCRRVMREVEPRLAAYRGYTPEVLRGLVDEAWRQGFAFNPGLIVTAMQAVAVPVMAANGQPLAALSVAAIHERMQPDRLAQAVDLLQQEARRMEAALRQRKPDVTGKPVQRRRKQ